MLPYSYTGIKNPLMLSAFRNAPERYVSEEIYNAVQDSIPNIERFSRTELFERGLNNVMVFDGDQPVILVLEAK